MKNKTKIIVILLAIIIIAGVLFLTGAIKSNGEKVLPDGSNTVSSTTEQTVGGVTYTGSGDFKVEQVPLNENVPAVKVPDLNRPLNFPVGTSPEVKTIIEAKIASNIAKLKKDPNLIAEWISLGINRKMISDYEGAKEAWEYAAIINPNYVVTFANLSDLYGYYLKDNVKAEAYYLKAIENDPASSNYYIRAANFYREVMGDLLKARAILIKGIAVIPNDVNLKNSLEQVGVMISEKNKATNPQ